MTTIIKGATVVDPVSGTSTQRDLAFADGVIIDVADAADATEIDGTGLYLSPGFIDLHCHVFPAAPTLGIDADRVGVRQGVTTLLDAGSTGHRDLDRWLREVHEPADTRVLAWINIATSGLVDNRHELVDMANVDEDATLAAIQAHPDVVRGIKVRMSSSVLGENGTLPLEAGVRVAEKAGVPIIIHTGNRPPDMSDSLNLLRDKDLCSHAFHGKDGGLFDGGDQLIPAATEALERGVRFDIGHGEASFSFDVFEKAHALGVRPWSISTDIHEGNVDGPVYSLAVTMSKMLACGLSLDDVILASTLHPAESIGMPELGTLDPGTPADLTLFEVGEESRLFTDAQGAQREGLHHIHPVKCFLAGKAYDCD